MKNSDELFAKLMEIADALGWSIAIESIEDEAVSGLIMGTQEYLGQFVDLNEAEALLVNAAGEVEVIEHDEDDGDLH